MEKQKCFQKKTSHVATCSNTLHGNFRNRKIYFFNTNFNAQGDYIYRVQFSTCIPMNTKKMVFSNFKYSAKIQLAFYINKEKED